MRELSCSQDPSPFGFFSPLFLFFGFFFFFFLSAFSSSEASPLVSWTSGSSILVSSLPSVSAAFFSFCFYLFLAAFDSSCGFSWTSSFYST